MWQKLNNLIASFQSYPDLSPDFKQRRQVNRRLQSRPALSLQSWYIRYWTPPARAKALPEELIGFVYHQLQAASGLDVGRFHPSDNLIHDLQFPGVCWFDWGITLCDQFYHQFGVDLGGTFDETQFVTVADLVNYLHGSLGSTQGESRGSNLRV